MKKVFKITIREILTLLFALILVMAAGLILDNSTDTQPRKIKKFEIKLRD